MSQLLLTTYVVCLDAQWLSRYLVHLRMARTVLLRPCPDRWPLVQPTQIVGCMCFVLPGALVHPWARGCYCMHGAVDILVVKPVDCH